MGKPYHMLVWASPLLTLLIYALPAPRPGAGEENQRLLAARRHLRSETGARTCFVQLPEIHEFFPTEVTFSPDLSHLPHLSNYYSKNNTNYPSKLGRHALNLSARFMTYPKL